MKNEPDMRLKSHNIVIGIDLGQRRDHTAIAVLDRCVWITRNRDPVTFAFKERTRRVIRDIFRLPLGTPYPDVVDAIKKVAAIFENRRLVVDATGLGGPVTDTLKKASLGRPIDTVLITSGEKVTTDGHGTWHVPKQHLVASPENAIHRRHLEISSQAREATALLDELRSFQVRTTGGGREIFTGEPHDGLVMAAALAVWRTYKLWP